jgi:uncharacterized membrane protein YdjX (TVP38/TMEM64 family)
MMDRQDVGPDGEFMTRPSAADGQGDGAAGIRPRRSSWRYVPFSIILAGLALAYSMGWHEHLSLSAVGDARAALKQLVAENPGLAPAVFVLVYVVVVSFPAAAVLTMLSGFLFGWFAGALYAIVAATIASSALFLAARTAFGGLLRTRVGTMAGFARAFEEDAFYYVLAMRIAPFIPFFVVSIAPAFFKVRFGTFLAASSIGILPGAFAYAWLGHGLDSVIAATEASGRDLALLDLVTPEISIALLALTLVAVLATIVRRGRRTHTS